MKTVSPDSLLCLPVFLGSEWFFKNHDDEKESQGFFGLRVVPQNREGENAKGHQNDESTWEG